MAFVICIIVDDKSAEGECGSKLRNKDKTKSPNKSTTYKLSPLFLKFPLDQPHFSPYNTHHSSTAS
ncbi:hypothetical protein, partial [Moraxella sp.]|uniref:hypothetical protein n=1 Tax=Moraxella sp. TaxID=479 RepID=UPI002609B85D